MKITWSSAGRTSYTCWNFRVIISAFCATGVPQNAKITQKIPKHYMTHKAGIVGEDEYIPCWEDDPMSVQVLGERTRSSHLNRTNVFFVNICHAIQDIRHNCHT